MHLAPNPLVVLLPLCVRRNDDTGRSGTPDIAGLGHLAALGKLGARFAARINLSALGNGAKMAQTGQALRLASDGLGYQPGKIELTDEYRQAGLFINPPRIIQETPLTSWGKRLHGRRPATVLLLEGTVEKNKALFLR